MELDSISMSICEWERTRLAVRKSETLSKQGDKSSGEKGSHV